jgi:ribonucleoside-diphosphate reductase alpha chain
MVTLIKKRDGSVVEFNRQKIRVAMEKAAQSASPKADLRPFSVMADHAARHVELKFGSGTPDVESVQDLVEKTLMEFGLFEAAKAYILYRAEHTKLRQSEMVETAEKLDALKTSYITAGGERKPLTKRWLNNRFTKAAKGLDDVVITLLVKAAEHNIYDGMSEAELEQALLLTTRSFIELDPQYSTLSTKLGLDGLYREVIGQSSSEGQEFKLAYQQAFQTQLKQAVADNRLVPEMLDFDLDSLADTLMPERDYLFDYLGFQTLYDRYFLRVEGGNHIYETPQAFWMRVAMGMALNEGESKNEWAAKFYEVISSLRYVPSTPTLFHSGTVYPQLSSCYLNTVEDDLGHIFKVYGDNAQLSKYSGGIGTDWTNVRATGSLIKTTNVGSQGIIPFLKIANDATHAINRSGKRRGAACVYLETWHLDFEDFLDLKRNTGDERRRTQDMNTAAWIPDLFMQRVIEGKDWTLFSPSDTPDLHHLYGKKFVKAYIAYEKKAAKGEISLFKIVPAKDLWRKMLTMLFETGHPWITWKDPSNIRSPQDHAGVIHNSNLCTEITLNTSATETAVCNLGSVNMAKHMKGKKTDVKLVAETVELAMRMLDNVIDVNFYPTIEAKASNMKHRPVGLGIMGFQDALYLAGIDFDSDKAVEFADQSMEIISYHAILGSSKLAKERQPYASYRGSKWDRDILPIDTLDLLEAERGTPIGVARSASLDWDPVRSHIKEFGMRNSNTMAIAPTATISNISGCYPCIEPIYKNLYVKSNMSGEFTVINSYLAEDLKALGLWNQTMIEELKRHDGSVQELTMIPPKLRSKYKETFEVGAEWLVKIAAHRGKWIDQSQSLNIFMQGTNGKRLNDIYMLAWHLGLKTTYYLRTMAATSVEKSTLDLSPTSHVQSQMTSQEAFISQPRLLAGENLIASYVEQPVAIAVEVLVPAQVQPKIEEVQLEEALTIEAIQLKACLIADPDCEACQ